MKLFFLVTFFFACLVSVGYCAESELLLKDNLARAHPGDFLVTMQNNAYTVLLVKSKTEQQLTLEEITIPAAKAAKAAVSWRQWVLNGAPGNTSWLMYVIQLPSGTMQQTFSYTKNEWVSIPQAQNFFSTLLNLRLKKIADHERKRVGPPPSDRRDTRRLWQPTLVVDGTPLAGVSFDAWRTRWPSDGTDLSGKIIEVYVPEDNDKYPSYFPYWLQISGLVGNAKIRIVDSGSGLVHTRG